VLISFLIALGASLIVLQIMVFSTTIYLHRSATHRALTLHPLAAWLFRFFTWLTTGIVPREWVAVHRKHHAHTDEEGDPHSPKLVGFWKVQLGNVFYYIKESRNDETVRTYAKDMLKSDYLGPDRVRPRRLGLLLGTGLSCSVLGWWGLFTVAFAGFMYVFVLSSSINGFATTSATRTSTTRPETSAPLRFSRAGRAAQQPPRTSRAREVQRALSEIDPAWPIIRTLEPRPGQGLEGRGVDGLLYDITRPSPPRSAVWPGDPPSREVLADLKRGDNITLSTLRATVHLGAHADAPSHTAGTRRRSNRARSTSPRPRRRPVPALRRTRIRLLGDLDTRGERPDRDGTYPTRAVQRDFARSTRRPSIFCTHGECGSSGSTRPASIRSRPGSSPRTTGSWPTTWRSSKDSSSRMSPRARTS
jgi:stearoyl-CoA desaturase (delta-9 desaturase)